MRLTKAEIEHIQRALSQTEHLLFEYPEIFTDRTEDQLKVALEIMNEDTIA